MPRHLTPLLLAVPLVVLAGCAAGEPTITPAPATAADDGHGDVAGAREVAEPAVAILTVDADGGVGMTDLITGSGEAITDTDAPLELASDGRYAFITTADGVSVVDSGRWTWDHVDHFHYYRADPREVGVVPGDGAEGVTVATGLLSTAGSTGLFFAASGDAVLLDNAALARGEIVESFRVETAAASGLIAPLGTGALVTIGDELVFHDADGTPTGSATECVAASGTITTRAGVVVGCEDGAVLATWENGTASYAHVATPDPAAPRADDFDGRKGRPTVAARAGEDGFWLLDTRAQEWTLTPTESPLSLVAAVGDEDDHVVAVDIDGRIRIFSEGRQTAVTDALVTTTAAGVSLVIDGQRAYIGDPESHTVLEIDYADSGRVARTLQTVTSPSQSTVVGR